MRILLTRPRAQAEPTARRLQAAGHDVVLAPVLEIVSVDGPQPSIGDVAAVLFTSVNGVQHGRDRLPHFDGPAFCVGARTAEAARAAGFAQVASADGDAEALAALVRSRVDPSAGALLHPCGRQRKAVLRERLAAAGYRLRELPVYEACDMLRLPDEARRALEEGDIDLVLVYSERSARRFLSLAEAGLDPERLMGLTAGALSEAAGAVLAGRVGRVIVAPRPDEASLMAALADATGVPFPAEIDERAAADGRTDR